VTHPHFDHYGSARTINEVNGAEVWAPKKGARWMENYEQELRNEEAHRGRLLLNAGAAPAEIDHVNAYYREANRFAHGAGISRYLEEGDTFELASLSFTVTEVPGHTPFCILLHDSENLLGFTGDFLLQDITSSPLVQWTDLRSPDYRTLKSYTDSLKKARAMHLKIAFPGHGKIMRDPTKKVDELLAFIKGRNAAVRQALRKGPLTPIEIVREVFPNHPREGLFRAVSDIMGHLEMLEEEGLVERTGDPPGLFRRVGS
jgi:glyoxylase-like metal-dependent hydrolase (beta-lactamase superfamily II)